jgi:hypothetical protein
MAALLGLQRSLTAFRGGGQGTQQIAQFPQRADGNQRGTDDEGRASGTEHPRGQRAGSAAFQSDEDDFAVGRSLAPLDRQALTVEGVPAIVDRYDFVLPKMMGIM